jgi:pimeloyl-ACP methyl ester carboxylesterase
MTAAVIDRAFARVPAGLIHYRIASPAVPTDEPPIYLAHAGPGSSRGLEELIGALGVHRRVIAPDMMGNGDSDPPPLPAPDVPFYVGCAVALLDHLGIEQVDFYGQHSGAVIGCELALAHPARVRRLVLDGMAVYADDLKRDMLEHYAPPVEPDAFGGHLAFAWHFVAGLFTHFPYYREDPDHRLTASAVPPPALRQKIVVELLKSLPTYHLAYRAMIPYPTAERLPLLAHPTLLMAVDADPLSTYLDEACALLPRAQRALATRASRAEVAKAFLIAPDAVVSSRLRME